MSNEARTCKITTDSTVDSVISARPLGVGVLNEFLIDTCCGRCATIGEAAAHAHADPATVVRALPTANSCDCGCR